MNRGISAEPFAHQALFESFCREIRVTLGRVLWEDNFASESY